MRIESSIYFVTKQKQLLIRQDKLSAIFREGQKAQCAADRNDTREVMAVVRRLAGNPVQPLASIKDENEKVIETVAEVTAKRRSHLQ